MPANVYECMFLLDPTKVAGDVPGAAQQLHAVLEKHKAEILASRPWDERRLAFPMGNHKKGLYYLTYFRVESTSLINIQHDFALHEPILRSMVLHIDPKLVDTMLALARDEHALALQAVAEDPTETGVPAAVDGEERPRRSGSRRPVEEEPADKD